MALGAFPAVGHHPCVSFRRTSITPVGTAHSVRSSFPASRPPPTAPHLLSGYVYKRDHVSGDLWPGFLPSSVLGSTRREACIRISISLAAESHCMAVPRFCLSLCPPLDIWAVPNFRLLCKQPCHKRPYPSICSNICLQVFTVYTSDWNCVVIGQISHLGEPPNSSTWLLSERSHHPCTRLPISKHPQILVISCLFHHSAMVVKWSPMPLLFICQKRVCVVYRCISYQLQIRQHLDVKVNAL